MRGDLLRAAQLTVVPATLLRPDVASIDRERILIMAQQALVEKPVPLTELHLAGATGSARIYRSEIVATTSPAGSTSSGTAGATPEKPTASSQAAAFTAHRDALFALGLRVPALAAAYALTGEDRYAAHAAAHLRAWFVDPQTSMEPQMERAAAAPGSSHGTYAGVIETLPLVEIVQAIPFLASSPAMGQQETSGLRAWFAAYLAWLTATEDSGPRLAALARDRKDHHGTSWLLQVTAYTRFTAVSTATPQAEAAPMTELRRRFRTVTLRGQMRAEGYFPQELTTDAPYRNSLFNLDMLAALCLLLSTRFESVWDYELEDGPGMRVAMAFHAPFIRDRNKWPYRADVEHFKQLPGRRASLLFGARAYRRPEYAELWGSLPPDPDSADVMRSMPIHQPLLWVREPGQVTARG